LTKRDRNAETNSLVFLACAELPLLDLLKFCNMPSSFSSRLVLLVLALKPGLFFAWFKAMVATRNFSRMSVFPFFNVVFLFLKSLINFSASKSANRLGLDPFVPVVPLSSKPLAPLRRSVSSIISAGRKNGGGVGKGKHGTQELVQGSKRDHCTTHHNSNGTQNDETNTQTKATVKNGARTNFGVQPFDGVGLFIVLSFQQYIFVPFIEVQLFKVLPFVCLLSSRHCNCCAII
jgi:hypothetical protein